MNTRDLSPTRLVSSRKQCAPTARTLLAMDVASKALSGAYRKSWFAGELAPSVQPHPVLAPSPVLSIPLPHAAPPSPSIPPSPLS
eukprot:scaffold147772_cov19-Tisochrysis_lutea.AAC.1